MAGYDYGPDLEALKSEFLRDIAAQERLAQLMDELENERRQLAHTKAQKKASRTELRNCEKSIANLENGIRAIFVNYALAEAPLRDGSLIVDETAAQGRGGFRPMRLRR